MKNRNRNRDDKEKIELYRPLKTFLDKIYCPVCYSNELYSDSITKITCQNCKQEYPIINDLPFLFCPEIIEDYFNNVSVDKYAVDNDVSFKANISEKEVD